MLASKNHSPALPFDLSDGHGCTLHNGCQLFQQQISWQGYLQTVGVLIKTYTIACIMYSLSLKQKLVNNNH